MIRAAGAALVLLAAGAASAQPVPPDTFRHERTVTVTTAGPQRLDLDATVLAGAQPVALYPVPQPDRRFVPNGPPDLRLYTMSGVEVPYLFVAPPLDHQKVVIGSVKAIAATEKTSGFEVDYRELIPALEVVALDQVPPPFLKRFRLEGSGDRTRWTVLIAEGTAFNLPAEGLRHVKIPFDPGDYRYLRVTWDDTNSARVSAPASAGAYHHVDAYAGPALRVPLTFERRNTEPGRSRFHVTLPGSRLPIMALDLTIGGGHLMRDVRVLEAALARDARPTDPGVTPQVIGQARLTRVIKDGATAEAIRVEIPRPPGEPDLDLVFDDGNNPPIDLQGVTAVFADLPWIYFESEPGTLIARYGSPKTEAPRYDLEAVRGSIPVALGRASWGAERTPPAEAPRPAPGLPMPSRGAAMTIGDFAYRRSLPSGPEGLSVIPLDAAALAHSASERGHFADIRVLDADGLQVP
ncbi:MAG TPA: DUF3999 family protein, partial [Vicinamibacterales bacterium]|nr:DUF3999 family protein [Vicinamibacterales bacterium]